MPLLLLFCLILVCACGHRSMPPVQQDGHSYGTTSVPFRGRWWHYYERGLSWAEGDFWDEAEADFRTCLRLRQSDARRARTYGMHFVQCFAHRELGAVLLEQEAYAEAEHHLRLSMLQVPSAKARYLLQELERRRQGQAAPAQPSPISLGSLPKAIDAENTPQRVDDDPRPKMDTIVASAQDAPTPAQESTQSVAPAPQLAVHHPAADSIHCDEQLWLAYEAQHAEGGHLLVTDAMGRTVAEQEIASKQVRNSVAIRLEPGANELHCQLIAADGRSSETHLRVRIDQQPLQDRSLRATASLLPPQRPHPSNLPIPSEAVGDALVVDGRFRFVDLEADQLLQQELHLVEAGYIDRVTSAAAGRRLQSRYVLTATMYHSRKHLECFLRLIHSESAEEVASVDIYAPESVGLDRFCAAVAGHLRQSFPVLAGHVQRLDEGAEADWRLNRGTRSGVSKHMRFHLLTAENSDQIAWRSHGEAEVLQVLQDHALLVGSPRDESIQSVVSE